MSLDEALETAARALRAGRLVAFPTETVYGLGAVALDREAVLRVYAAKGRPRTSPLIVHVLDVAAARRLSAVWPADADRLAAAFWPGPLTLIVPKADAVPDEVTAGLPTVGLRVPAHPVARRLLAAAGVPLAAPSANPFTRLSSTRADDVRRAFAQHDVLVLDGGQSSVGIESTVVALDGPIPRLLRPGAVPAADLLAVIDRLDTTPATAPTSGGHAAPGLHGRHYSPQTRLVLVTPDDTWPEGAVAWLHRGAAPRGPVTCDVRLPDDPAAYAARLYATLHDLDARAGERIDVIAVQPPPDAPAWDAVRDRLRRAAT